ncbi:MAG: hypothetical protein ACYS8K_10695, partial [Planctomycetota bacterium]
MKRISGSPPSPGSRWLHAALLLACASFLALRAAPAAGGAEPVSLPVLLPLARDAANELEAAERLIARSQWERALPILQSLLEADGQRLLWDGEAYVPAADLVNRRIGSLPPAARRSYALLYDAGAGRLCRRGIAERSEQVLAQVADRYLHTSHGPRAVSALALVLMDRGEFGAALLALRRTDGLALGP